MLRVSENALPTRSVSEGTAEQTREFPDTRTEVCVRSSNADSTKAEAVGLEPTIRAKRTPVFETGPSSGRMTSV
jgi:hypothetical protein